MTSEITWMLIVAGLLTVIAVLLFGIPMWRRRQASGERTLVPTLTAGIILIPIAVMAIYSQVSTYPWSNPEITAANATASGGGQPPVETMLVELANRMATNPDVKGLALLGQSYMALQRYPEAVDAWHAAWEMSEGNDTDVTIGYAEALVLADRNTLTTSAADLLDDALSQRPDDPRALWYGGLSAAAADNTELAQARWTRLLNNPELPEQLRGVLQQQLAALSGAAPVQGATAAQVSNAGTIEASIRISPALAPKVAKGAILFVIAREAGRPGPPVAAKRLTVGEFPLRVSLSNADVMISGNSLANIGQLELTARVANGGDPIARPGDLFGTVRPDTLPADGAPIEIVIDKIQE